MQDTQKIKSLLLLLIPHIALSVILLFSFSEPSIGQNDPFYPFHPEIKYNLTSSNLPIVIIELKEKMANREENRRTRARMKILYRPDGSRNYVSDTISKNNMNPNIVNYNGDVSIKYRGHSSFLADKKPFSFKTQNSVGENQDVNILGMGSDSDWALLAPFYDKSLIREVLIFDIMKEYLEFSPKVKYCEVVLNGIYQGIYIMIARPRESSSRLNLPKPKSLINRDALTGGYLLKFDWVDEDLYFTSNQYQRDIYGNKLGQRHNIIHEYPQKKHYDSGEMNLQKEYIENYIHSIEAVLAGENYKDPEKGYRKYWDVTSMLDYMLAQEMTRNADAYRLSTPFYKRRDSVDPRIKMTIWDFDQGWGNSRIFDSWSSEGWAWNSAVVSHPFWFKRFLSDESFREELWERWRYYRNTQLTNDNIISIIDSLVNVIDEAKNRNFIVWNRWGQEVGPNYYISSSFHGEIAYLKRWILKRFNWLDSQFQPYPDNYIVNGSFDADSDRGVGFSNITYLSGWTASSNKDVTLSTNNPYNGRYNLSLKNQSRAYQVITELPKDIYTLKAWVRTVGNPNASVIVRVPGVKSTSIPIANNNDYTEISVDDVLIENGVCEITFQTKKTSNENEKLFVDNVSLYSSFRTKPNNVNYSNTQVKTYPNPFVDKVNFEYVSQDYFSDVIIYSVDGCVVDVISVTEKVGTEIVICWNVPESLAPGIYFYTIKTGDQLYKGKILKR